MGTWATSKSEFAHRRIEGYTDEGSNAEQAVRTMLIKAVETAGTNTLEVSRSNS
jgi:hypothetical protein